MIAIKVEDFHENSCTASWEDLSALEPYLQERQYDAGQVLWAEGEISGRLVLIDRGRVKALRVLSDGTSILLYVFGPGNLFGFLPFVDGGAYPATAIAVDAVKARVMTRSSLRRAIREDPQVAMVLLNALGSRLREAFRRMGDQAQPSAVSRTAAALTLLLPAQAKAGQTIISIPHPKQDFAADLGMTAATFSRALTKLVDAAVLHRLTSPQLQVLDPEKLSAIAAGKVEV